MRVIIIILFMTLGYGQMVVRSYVSSLQPLTSALGKGNLRIASGRYGQYCDLVVNPFQYQRLKRNGIKTEVLIEDLLKEKEKYRWGYHSYDEVNQILRDHAQNHPSICKFDSIGTSYEGRWIYCLKISDGVNINDPSEPDILFDALHHAEEWSTIEVVLFFADTLTLGYNVDPVITDLINNNEIWIVPIVNVDGYVYDYPDSLNWRKNRKPFGGAMGTDPNRNYPGVCGPEPLDGWGHIPQGGSVSHRPSSWAFCGAYTLWADCDNALANLIRNQNFIVHITYHSYAEMILWPWCHKTGATPDATLYQQLANTMSQLIQKLYGGDYDPAQLWYPLSGSTDGWVYGYNHYIGGEKCLSYTLEIGTTYYQSVDDLSHIAHENWEGALFLARMADSIRNNVPSEVPAPDIAPMDTVHTPDFTVHWSPSGDEWNNPDYWQLDELKDYSHTTDDLESGTDFWNLDGFSLSTNRYHSPNHSLYSGQANNVSHIAQTKYPYLVQADDSVKFWCWYNLENNYDAAVVEVSTEDREWFQVNQRFTGSSGGWIRRACPLQPWEGEWIYIRFRMMTDDGGLYEGFYVDDISPVPDFGSQTTISSSIPDTSYQITDQPDGQYFYQVRGHNTRGWGRFSQLEDVEVQVGIAEEVGSVVFSYQLLRSPSRVPVILFTIPAGKHARISVIDVLGRRVKSDIVDKSCSYRLSGLAGGIYFLEIDYQNQRVRDKLVIVY